MTFCRMCGKLLQNELFNPSEITICKKCEEVMRGDLVRVVRCKDCDNKKCLERTGNVVCGIDGNSHRPDWFCAYGKRKEGR